MNGIIDNLKKTVNNWWLLLILGILCVIASAYFFTSPDVGTMTVGIILAIFLLVSGVLGIIFVISNRKEIPAWGWNLVLPILTVIAGIILIANLSASTVFVICLFAVGILFKAIDSICYAISMSGVQGSGWGWTLAGGIICMLLAFYLFASPLFTWLAIGYFVGFALLFIGIETIVISIQLSKIKGEAKRMAEKQ